MKRTAGYARPYAPWQEPGPLDRRRIRRRAWRVVAGLGVGLTALVVVTASPAGAQSLSRRVDQAAPGKVRFSFAAQPDICGDGDSILRLGDEAGRVRVLRGSNLRGRARWSGDATWADCVFGPIIVTLDVRDSGFDSADVRVGDRTGTAATTELGHVPAQEAVDYLLERVVPHARQRAAQAAMLATVLADSAEAWPALLEIGRDEALPRQTRHNAIFWVGQAAAERATAGLDALARDEAEDIEVRKHALFALSQQPREVGVPALIDVARSATDPELVRTSLFWLGQSRDDRALALFREILTRR